MPDALIKGFYGFLLFRQAPLQALLLLEPKRQPWERGTMGIFCNIFFDYVYVCLGECAHMQADDLGARDGIRSLGAGVPGI